MYWFNMLLYRFGSRMDCLGSIIIMTEAERLLKHVQEFFHESDWLGSWADELEDRIDNYFYTQEQNDYNDRNHN